jgi:heme-degrading monooxygenase HmoA
MIRLVKMTFREEEIGNFKEVFESRRAQIAAFPGCEGVSLLQDKNDPRIFFTYSRWRSEQDLEEYRNSTLFRETWQATKQLFAGKPAAWSVEDTGL